MFHIQAKDRAISEKSIVHQLDQVLRKHISQKLEELRGIFYSMLDLINPKPQARFMFRIFVSEPFKP